MNLVRVATVRNEADTVYFHSVTDVKFSLQNATFHAVQRLVQLFD